MLASTVQFSNNTQPHHPITTTYPTPPTTPQGNQEAQNGLVVGWYLPETTTTPLSGSHPQAVPGRGVQGCSLRTQQDAFIVAPPLQSGTVPTLDPPSGRPGLYQIRWTKPPAQLVSVSAI